MALSYFSLHCPRVVSYLAKKGVFLIVSHGPTRLRQIWRTHGPTKCFYHRSCVICDNLNRIAKKVGPESVTARRPSITSIISRNLISWLQGIWTRFFNKQKNGITRKSNRDPSSKWPIWYANKTKSNPCSQNPNLLGRADHYNFSFRTKQLYHHHKRRGFERSARSENQTLLWLCVWKMHTAPFLSQWLSRAFVGNLLGRRNTHP